MFARVFLLIGIHRSSEFNPDVRWSVKLNIKQAADYVVFTLSVIKIEENILVC